VDRGGQDGTGNSVYRLTELLPISGDIPRVQGAEHRTQLFGLIADMPESQQQLCASLDIKNAVLDLGGEVTGSDPPGLAAQSARLNEASRCPG
jgi:hypothetical protein